MKYLLVLFCIFSLNSLRAQTVDLSIQNLAGDKLKGASVFDVNNKNKLIAISDENGLVALLPDVKYLVHYLGYKDSLIQHTANLKVIKLEKIQYSLPEVRLGANKTRLFHISERPDFIPSLGISMLEYDLTGRASYEKLCKITVSKEGYLKSFSLFAHLSPSGTETGEKQQVTFLLYDNADGLPGKLIIKTQIHATFKHDRLHFDLSDSFLFLHGGDYFIGYEGISSLVAKNRTDAIKAGNINIAYRKTLHPELFIRRNRSKWVSFTWINPNGNKKSFYSFGYELEMEVPVKN